MFVIFSRPAKVVTHTAIFLLCSVGFCRHDVLLFLCCTVWCQLIVKDQVIDFCSTGFGGFCCAMFSKKVDA